jgi:hypothetical protein
MDWKHLLMSTAEKVFDTWLRTTHGDAFAADYWNEDDPDMRIDRDPRNYPKYMTDHDMPDYLKNRR